MTAIHEKLYNKSKISNRYGFVSKLQNEVTLGKLKPIKGYTDNINNNNDNLDDLIVKQKKLTVKEFVALKKKILLTKLNIEKLEQNKNKLDNIIENQEKTFQMKKEDLIANDNYFQEKYNSLKHNLTDVNINLNKLKDLKTKKEDELKHIKNIKLHNNSKYNNLNNKLAKLIIYKKIIEKIFIDIDTEKFKEYYNNKQVYITEDIIDNNNNSKKDYVKIFVDKLKKIEDENLKLIENIKLIEQQIIDSNMQLNKYKSIEKDKLNELAIDIDRLKLNKTTIDNKINAKLKYLMVNGKEVNNNRINNSINIEQLRNVTKNMIKNLPKLSDNQTSSNIFSDIQIIENLFETLFIKMKKYYKENKNKLIYEIKKQQNYLKQNKDLINNRDNLEKKKKNEYTLKNKINKKVDKTLRKDMKKMFVKKDIIIEDKLEEDLAKKEEEYFFK